MARKQSSIKPPSPLTLADLQRLIGEREAAVAELIAQRRMIADELAGIDAQIAGATGKVKSRSGRKPDTRGPGRPPKFAMAATPDPMPLKRGPGRPRKIDTTAPSGPAPVKREPRHSRKNAPAANLGRAAKQKATPIASAPLKDHGRLYAAIRVALTGATQPIKAGEIAEKVVAGGYATTSGAFHLEVGRRLAEMPEVARSDSGAYALK